MGSSRQDRLKMLMGDEIHPMREPLAAGTSENLLQQSTSRALTSQGIREHKDAEVDTAEDGCASRASFHVTTATEDDGHQKLAEMQLQQPAPSRAQTSSGASTGLAVSQHTLNNGQLARADEKFCLVQVITKFPFKFVKQEDQEKVYRPFFSGGKFWDRAWRLYYLHVPPYIAVNPLVLIPVEDVKIFFDDINHSLGTNLNIYSVPSSFQVVLSFEDYQTLRPRFLGECTSRTSYDTLKATIPRSDFQCEDEDPHLIEPTNATVKRWEMQLESALMASKKGGASKKRSKGKVLKTTMGKHPEKWFSDPLRVTQDHLGVRGLNKKTKTASEPQDPKPDSLPDSKTTPATIPNISVPSTSELNVVFIAVDIESYERDQKKITEIGLAYLDTQLINGMPPGEGGKAWMDTISAMHFRISDHSHLENRDFVRGCARHFEFGESSWLSLSDAAAVMERCFRTIPRGANNKPTSTASSVHVAGEDRDSTTARQVIIVGHTLPGDIRSLQRLGYDPTSATHVIGFVDLATIDCAVRAAPGRPRALGAMLDGLGILAWHLHNAGNDAVYTMMALVGLALRHADGVEAAAAAATAAAVGGGEGKGRAIPEDSWDVFEGAKEAEKEEDVFPSDGLTSRVETAAEAEGSWVGYQSDDGGVRLPSAL